MLDYMLPSSAMNDQVNRAQAYVVPQCECFLEDTASDVLGTNSSHVVGCELGTPVSLSTGYSLRAQPAVVSVPTSQSLGVCPAAAAITPGHSFGVEPSRTAIAASGSASSGHMGKILSVGSSEEMRQITALAVGNIPNGVAHIAGVADENAILDRSVGKSLHNPMRRPRPATIGDGAIAGRGESSLPRPAIIRPEPVDATPQALLDGPSSVVMVTEILERLTSDPALGSGGLASKPSPLAATALTEADRDGRIVEHLGSPIQNWGAAPPAVASGAEAFACPQYTTLGR